MPQPLLYPSAHEWHSAQHKQVLLFAMSGLGKTHLAKMLRSEGHWFHYSIDYRIGTYYLGHRIADNAKTEAMKVPFLRDLLRSNSIYIGSNISFDDLRPVSSYLGKPGDPDKGGLLWNEYQTRQDQFQAAEVAALLDTEYFINRAKTLYGYSNFICDTGGSICEWVDADNPDDTLLTALAQHTLMVWIEGTEAHTQDLIKRFDKDPKPMSYDPVFLTNCWTEYLAHFDVKADKVDPNHFIRWTYERALNHRQPRYEKIAQNWGVSVPMDEVSRVKNSHDFTALIGEAVQRRTHITTPNTVQKQS